MIVVGLTGGVATGKSTVAKLFKQCGAIVIDADERTGLACAIERLDWSQQDLTDARRAGDDEQPL